MHSCPPVSRDLIMIGSGGDATQRGKGYSAAVTGKRRSGDVCGDRYCECLDISPVQVFEDGIEIHSPHVR